MLGSREAIGPAKGGGTCSATLGVALVSHGILLCTWIGIWSNLGWGRASLCSIGVRSFSDRERRSRLWPHTTFVRCINKARAIGTIPSTPTDCASADELGVHYLAPSLLVAEGCPRRCIKPESAAVRRGRIVVIDWGLFLVRSAMHRSPSRAYDGRIALLLHRSTVFILAWAGCLLTAPLLAPTSGKGVPRGILPQR